MATVELPLPYLHLFIVNIPDALSTRDSTISSAGQLSLPLDDNRRISAADGHVAA